MQPVHGARVFLAKDLGSRRLHKAVLEAVEHGAFQLLAPHFRFVRASPFIAGVRAADINLAEMHDPAATDGASHQAGKQIARASPVPIARRLAGAAAGLKRALPRLHALPQILIDDP
jgi:hypothetical protein